MDGDAEVTTGSGDVVLGAVGGRARIRTGSGTVRVGAVAGSTDIKAGSGDVRIGAVQADVGVRTGTGAVSVADASAGRLDLTTGSGGLTIGVHAGVLAELDLSSGSGRARSELDVRRPPRAASRCCGCAAAPPAGTCWSPGPRSPSERAAGGSPELCGERGGEVAPLTDHHPVQPLPGRQLAQGGRQLGHDPRPVRRHGGRAGRLAEGARHAEHARHPVRLEVDPRDQGVVEQERET